jgi:hypothetical protein
MVKSKDSIKEEMSELQGIIKMYQEAFPENPVWQQIGGKKEKMGGKNDPATSTSS